MKCKYLPEYDCDEQECKDSCKLNVFTEMYLKEHGLRVKGWYSAFQKTKLWRLAKNFLLVEKRKEGEIVCSICNELILDIPILHHFAYDWVNFFLDVHVGFVHDECHKKWHQENPLPKWQNLPDKLHDMFSLNPKELYLFCCWKCNSDYEGFPYQFLCNDCYWDLKNRGIDPNWRDFL